MPFSYTGAPSVPSSIEVQHDSLLAQLSGFWFFNDSTSKAVLKLKLLLEHHFKEEEDFIFPALGVLPQITAGKIPEKSTELIQLIDRFKNNSAHIVAEHQLVKVYLAEMLQAAAQENHPQVKDFETQLALHASEEEQVYFPTLILIGDYLKLKSASKMNE